jgi:hypothetical protein
VDRDQSAFLVQLSIAIHKSATYPPRHPLAAAAVDAALTSLGHLLERGAALSLGVARTQIIIDGEGTDPAHPVLRELAQRLYRCQLGGITFSPGVTADELAGVLRAVTGDAGALAANDPAAHPHVRLYPLAFDQLRLADGADGAEALDGGRLTRLWADLAGSALGLRAETAEGPGNPQALAAAIDTHAAEPAYARAVTRQLLALGRQARQSDGVEERKVSRQLADLLASLKPETLHRLLQLGPDPGQRDQLLVEISRAMPITAVIELVRASADATEQTISHGLLRILAKLAAHAEGGAAGAQAEADDSLREMVRELVDDWGLKDPNPAPYSEMLEGFARPGAGSATARPAPKASEVAEPLRLVQTALELGVSGPSVVAAVDALVERREIPLVLDLLTQAPAGDPATEAVWARLPTLDELRRALTVAEPDAALVERLLPRLGLDAVEPLLDALSSSDSRTTRRRLLTWLAQLGPGIGPMVMARLASPHWYVLRNMLLLLAGVEPWPPGFSPAAYLTHADARVRREALKLALKSADLRDEAICAGLTDGDDFILRTAVAAALDGCPAEAAPLLVDQLESRVQPADVRLQIVRVLAQIRVPAARDCLIRRALARRRWLPWKRLAPKSSETVAAIAGLAGHWSADPTAAEVLRLAGKSRDAEVRAAAGVPT